MSPTSLIATLGGIGRAPVAPGTVASLVALPFAYVLSRYAGTMGLLLATVAASVVGIWASDLHARSVDEVDPSECVVDELAGQWLTCAFAPLSPGGFALAFVLFRLFDMLKPWPTSRAEKLPGGLGIVADDLVAAVMAGILLLGASMVGVIGPQ
jgi:phosphatidylglycerophosphatase A